MCIYIYQTDLPVQPGMELAHTYVGADLAASLSDYKTVISFRCSWCTYLCPFLITLKAVQTNRTPYRH